MSHINLLNKFISNFRKHRKKSIALGLLVLLILSFTAAIILNLPEKVEAAWWDDTFGYRHRVSFTHDADLTTRAVTFTLDTAELVAANLMQSDCDDTRFTTINGEPLSYDLTGTCNNASTTYEVIFPTIVNGSNVFFVYYGNPSATNAEIDSTGYTALTPSGGDPSLTNPTSSGNQEKTVSPVAYWRFDEGTGTTVQDSSSNNSDGTITGATWQTEDMCISGKCLKFDGSDDVVQITETPRIDLGGTSDSYSTSAWFRTGSSNGRIISKDDGSGSYPFALYLSSGTACFLIHNTGVSTPSVCSTVTFNDNQWHHVTGVRNTGTDTIYLYLDGKLQGSANDSTTGSLANNDNVSIGNAGTSYTQHDFNGTIDNVKIYNYARSDAQIKADFQRSAGTEGSSVVLGSNTSNLKSLSDGLVGYWKMDESSTPSVDYSGNGRNATWLDNTSSVTGKYSNAVSFDGTDDGMSVSMTGIDTFSYAAWVKADITGSTQEQYIITTDVGGNNNCRFLQFRNQNDNWNFGGQAGGSIATSTSSVTAGRWYYIVGTNDQTTNTSRLYVDGTLVGASTASTCTQSDNATYRFGRSSYQPHDNDFAGDLDEVRIYNRVLSPSEVSQLYNWAPGPVGYWKFDEGEGGVSSDSSSNSLSGTISNGTWTAGKYGKAVKFNGSNTCINYGNPSLLGLANDISISLWFKYTPGTRMVLVDKGYDGAFRVGYIHESNQTTTWFHGSGSGVSTQGQLLPTTQGDQWYHLEMVRDSVAKTYKGYLNGVQVSNSSYTTPVPTNTSHNVYIGCRDGSSEWFNGIMDDIRIYNYSRTQKQIIQDMNAGHPSVGSPVGSAVGHWKFDEGADNTCSGGTNDACNSGSGGISLDGTSTASRSNSGKFNKALSFDGTDDVATVTNSSAIDFDAGLNSGVTFSAWVNPDTVGEGSAGQIFAKSSTTYCQLGGSTPFNITCSLDLSTDATVTVNSVIPASTWTHVALSWTNDSDDEISVYINGQRKGSSTNGVGPNSTDTSNLLIGGGTGNNFDGFIDDFKVYGFELTADEVKLDYNQGRAQVLGALGDNSNYAPGSANQIYCVPGDTTSCAPPVAEWKFEEGQGNTVNDTSGNSYTGIWSTSGDHWASGKFGKGSKFNGDDIRIDVGNEFNTSSMTWSAWIKSDTFSSSNGFSRRILSQSSGTGATDNEIQLVVNTSSKAVWYGYDNAYLWNLTGNTTLAVDQWYHITGTIDGSSARLYVNGILDASSSYTGSIATTSNLDIGDHSSVTGASFDGVIDQIRIYNYSRTPAQIAWDYNQGAPVAHWKLDECQGSTANDSSGNGFAGTITPGDSSGDNDTVGSCGSGVTTEMWNDGTTGKYNGSLGFDGTNDRVSMGDVLDMNNSFSLSAWAYVGASVNSTIVGKSLTNNGTGYYMDFSNGAGRKFRMSVKDSSNTTLATGTTTASLNTWYHVVGIFDQPTQTTYIYLNGKLDGMQSGDTSGSLANANNFSVSGFNGGTEAVFTGLIDDVRIYNYALSQTQIEQVYNQGSAVRFGPAEGSP